MSIGEDFLVIGFRVDFLRVEVQLKLKDYSIVMVCPQCWRDKLS